MAGHAGAAFDAKSALMEAVLALVPEEQQVQYSAMTGQSRLVLHPAFESRFNLLIPHRFRALHAPYPQPPILNKRFRNKSNTFACTPSMRESGFSLLGIPKKYRSGFRPTR